MSSRIYADTADIARGQFYKMDIEVTFDPNGNGHLTVARDGHVLVDYTGPLGYSGQTAVYWKEGIYQAEAPETIAADYKGLGIATTAATQAPANAGFNTVRTFDADGHLSQVTVLKADGSTTSDLFDAGGALTQETVRFLDGSSTIKTFVVGVLTQLVEQHVDSSREIYEYGITGKPYTSAHLTYNWAGQLVTIVNTNVDGSTTTNTYASGTVLTKSVLTRADHSSAVDLLGFTGRSYVSEHDEYSAAGKLLSIVRLHADGSRDSAQSFPADGSVTTSEYDATGHLTRTTLLRTDGSRTVDLTNITGKAYASDHSEYGATGLQVLYQQFHADGTLAYAQSRAGDGSTTYSTYGATGILAQQTTACASGATLATAYDAKGMLTMSTFKGSDGSTDVKQYDAAGHLTREALTRLDGSRFVDLSNITGKAYTSDHSEYDAAGNQVLYQQFHADGTPNYAQSRAADGSITYSTYGATGIIAQATTAYASGANLAKVYDAKGALASSTSKAVDGSVDVKQFDSAGHLVRESLTRADGSRVVDLASITGKTYASDHSEYNAAGIQTLYQQFRADGTISYAQSRAADGSMTYSTYSLAGILGQQTTAYASGTNLTTIFDAKGVISMSTLKGTDGSTDVKQFDSAGHLTRETLNRLDGSRIVDLANIVGKAYVSDHSEYNVAGIQVLYQQFHADGTLNYAQSRGSDNAMTYATYDLAGHLTQKSVISVDGSTLGSWYGATGVITQSILKAADGSTDVKQYDAAGHVAKDTLTHTDGSRDVDTFGITGQTYVSQHVTLDAKNVQTALVRYHADGTKDSSQILNAEATVTTSQYDAGGKLLTTSTPHKDGSLTASTYVAGGAVAQTTETHANGTKDVYAYSITGKPYTDAHWFYDVGGRLQVSDSSNTDGTHSVNLAAANVTVTGTDHVDIFTSFGGDTFRFAKGSGADVINGFHAGDASDHDTVQLSQAVVADFAHLTMHQAGRDTSIDLGGGDSILLKGVALASLTGHDFLFV